MLEDELLKAYTGINKDLEHPLVKILVSYIKPSFLFKSDVLTPIHLGRAVEREASKDGTISDEDIKWLHENCIGDDDFEGNISSVNRRVGFLTGTYWAWKNYDKLGNPEYFGSFGYRKLLVPTYIKQIKNYDIIAPTKIKFKISLKQQFINCHGIELYNVLTNILKKVYPEDISLFHKYFNENNGYYHELYIMKKDCFFKFCEWIFKILSTTLTIYNENIKMEVKGFQINKQLLCKFLEIDEKTLTEKINKSPKGKENRDIAFILERLTGFYLYKLSQNNNIRFLEIPFIETEYVNNTTKINKIILNKMRNKIINEQARTRTTKTIQTI